MNRNLKIYLGFFVFVVLLLTFFQMTKKPLIDWRRNYDLNSKAPFGLFVFNKEADTLFNHRLQRITESPYDFYSKKTLKKPQNILLIERVLDSLSWMKILNQVKAGSDLMVISDSNWTQFPDSLKIRKDQVYSGSLADSVATLSFTDKRRPAILRVNRLPDDEGIARITRHNVEILGKMRMMDSRRETANFIKVKFGKGNIFYHVDPTFISNYYLLKPGDQRYAEQVFSYLPADRETYWFMRRYQVESSSPMRFILSSPPLRYAWYVFLLGLIGFIVFSGKRKQRVVPIIEPLKNTSVDFVRSIGNLYLNEGDVGDMMRKKVNYFLNRIRTDLLINTQYLDEEFCKRLQVKTDKDLEEVVKAVEMIQNVLNKKLKETEENLLVLNQLLDSIYK